ncbi:hypothetical protein CBG24_03685 [Limosilactobacillus reuteri]|uniref:Uncharacterized protein n=1 Tax=Limosilactobacillus reuteri TaxID=1598 RepID=A0AB73PYW9_LIMRT|nr:hypothetical protein CBG19_09115 [Limosilactobacillus reuteri]OYS89318.1 hypothetical protein CBG18_07875 [Limosilactobacillus reuteri]OYS94448.1 hypothetical protein CBG15_04255 [Limosilactobacillus reuteri]OYS96304.1 hypothetical protein CBG10_02475 [Limosilactobacillus reuteri]OYS98209.1 hypothetical protein CBG13_02330 [Limosilactobacillus reuteri]
MKVLSKPEQAATKIREQKKKLGTCVFLIRLTIKQLIFLSGLRYMVKNSILQWVGKVRTNNEKSNCCSFN